MPAAAKAPAKKKPAPKKRATTASTTRKRTSRASTKDPKFFGGWEPRPHQADKFEAFKRGIRYHFYGWHRRAGKDNFALNLASTELRETIGTYWHLFPLHVQARRAIWKGMDKAGFKFLDQAFPDHIRSKTYETDMLIEFTNGSTWQLAGSDYYDRLVGANVRGVTFSEWALCDPRAWTYVAPIIRENNGWAMFITTFRGRNHAWQMYQRVKDNPEWCAEVLTIDDTGLLTESDMDAERANGVSEAIIQQEYYCNPLASADGAIYGSAMQRLLSSRAGNYSYDPSKPVRAAWSFKHFPVNISVVFAQENTIIGSSSFMFEDFQDCYAEVSNSLPWPVAEHIVLEKNSEAPSIDILNDAGLYPRVVIESREQTVVNETNNFLHTAFIDNLMRPFAKEGNNVLLVDSLNGYTAKEKEYNVWTMSGNMSEHDYLTHALETYALWYRNENKQHSDWSKKPNYTIQDRAVI